MIPFLDLKAVNAQYSDELKEACSRVIDSGWYIQGKECEFIWIMYSTKDLTKEYVLNGDAATTLR